MRYAALIVLTLTVLKVFLWDLAALGGLYPVFSFFGLGLSLVGVGLINQRLVLPKPPADEATQAS